MRRRLLGTNCAMLLLKMKIASNLSDDKLVHWNQSFRVSDHLCDEIADPTASVTVAELIKTVVCR